MKYNGHQNRQGQDSDLLDGFLQNYLDISLGYYEYGMARKKTSWPEEDRE
jgi:hypothetical protein